MRPTVIDHARVLAMHDMSERAVARALGISTRTVSNIRRAAGLTRSQRIPPDLIAAVCATRGTESAAAVARRLGITKSRAAHIRQNYGRETAQQAASIDTPRPGIMPWRIRRPTDMGTTEVIVSLPRVSILEARS